MDKRRWHRESCRLPSFPSPVMVVVVEERVNFFRRQPTQAHQLGRFRRVSLEETHLVVSLEDGSGEREKVGALCGNKARRWWQWNEAGRL